MMGALYSKIGGTKTKTRNIAGKLSPLNPLPDMELRKLEQKNEKV